MCKEHESFESWAGSYVSGVTIIAPEAPRYSEAWMETINRLYGPKVRFVSLVAGPTQNVSNLGAAEHYNLSTRGRLPLRVHRFLFKRQILFGLARLLKSLPEEEIIYIHYATTALYVASVLKELEQAIFIQCHGHDVTWDRKIEGWPPIRAHPKRYPTNVLRHLGKYKFVANSYATREKLLAIGIPSSAVLVNYLSVDVDRFSPPERSSGDGEGFQVLYVGRLVDFKGPIETMLAFEKLCDKGVVAELHIVGMGPCEKKCRQLRERSKYKDQIVFHGALSQDGVIELYRRADVFTAHNKRSKQTNQEEAFGVSVVEAMSCGLPVVTGASGGVVETVVDGETGYLFKPGSITQHTECLYRLVDPPLRAQFSTNARQRVLKKFNTAEEQKHALSLFKSVSD